MKHLSALVICLLSLVMALPSRADSVRAENVTAGGTSAVVRLFIHDTSGTPLGMDAGATKRIQGIAVKATFSPASSIASVSIARSGVLASLAPLFESTPSTPASVSYVAAFSETTSPIPFTSGGDEFARITVTLSPSAAPGSVIAVTLDASLSNQAGTISETALNGLSIVNGSIRTAALTASFGPALQLPAQAQGDLTLSFSQPLPSPLIIALSSSDPAVATVGASVSAPAGVQSVAVPVSSGSPGTCTITATLPASAGGASVTASVRVVGPPSSAPAAPAPADAAVNVPPSITLRWGAVSSATSYAVAIGKQNPPTDKSFTTSTAFLPVDLDSGTTYYWRVTAKNLAGAVSGPVWSFTTAETTVCRMPDLPVLAAPAEVTSGAGYDVTWQSIANATEVEIEQSTDPNFGPKTSQTAGASTRLASFSHVTTQDQRFYYRARARNTAANCGLATGYSEIITVLVRGVLIRILPVAGSLQGSLGSLFRTSLQLHNAGSSLIAGAVIFHPQGRSATGSDPRLVYALGPHETKSWADVVVAIGTAGIGSLEIESSLGDLPRVVARIYNDAGEKGTAGLTEPLIDPGDALDSSATAILIAPPDASKTRFNIGVRTLGEPTTIRFTAIGPAGQTAGTVTVAYQPGYFEQRSASDILQLPIGSDYAIEIAIVAGRAIVYGSSTDNITQDPSIQIATRRN